MNRLLGQIRAQQAEIAQERSRSRSSRREANSSASVTGTATERGTSSGRVGTRPSSRQAEEERDDVAVLSAECSMVWRENRMLKGRIRELERLVGEAKEKGGEV